MADHTPHAEELAASPNLLERLRAAQLDPQMLRIGWLAEAADEIARLTRERDALAKRLAEIGDAFDEYCDSEGCGCCSGSDHSQIGSRIKRLLESNHMEVQ